MDILSRAAEAFNRLLSISYSFFIVDKGCKSEIILNFAAGDFLHLSGIHYLAGNMYRDKKRFFEDALRGRILYSDLWETAQKSNMPVPYDIESRISLLTDLENFLELPLEKLKIQRHANARSKIKADYMFYQYRSFEPLEISYAFTIKRNPGETYCCNSLFTSPDNSYISRKSCIIEKRERHGPRL